MIENTTKIKLECISNAYLYIQLKEDRYKIAALKVLKELASAYHLNTKKVLPIDSNKALTMFVQGNEPIGNLINKLSSSIENF